MTEAEAATAQAAAATAAAEVAQAAEAAQAERMAADAAEREAAAAEREAEAAEAAARAAEAQAEGEKWAASEAVENLNQWRDQAAATLQTLAEAQSRTEQRLADLAALLTPAAQSAVSPSNPPQPGPAAEVTAAVVETPAPESQIPAAPKRARPNHMI
jgi:hypothetical protein